MSPYIRVILIILFVGVIAFSLYQLWDTENNNKQEEQVREQMSQYKPTPIPYEYTRIEKESEKEEEWAFIINQSIADAQEINPDVVGWLTVDGTRIDYPFVQTEDNDYYMHRDVNEKYAYAGTLFMDYKNSADMSGFSTIIYGHNMKNGSMFSGLRQYANEGFFDTNRTGRLTLLNSTYELEIFAYMTVRSDDAVIYGSWNIEDDEKPVFLEYIEEKATCFRDIEAAESDKFLVLSTCAYNFKEARSVIVARLVRIA